VLGPADHGRSTRVAGPYPLGDSSPQRRADPCPPVSGKRHHRFDLSRLMTTTSRSGWPRTSTRSRSAVGGWRWDEFGFAAGSVERSRLLIRYARVGPELLDQPGPVPTSGCGSTRRRVAQLWVRRVSRVGWPQAVLGRRDGSGWGRRGGLAAGRTGMAGWAGCGPTGRRAVPGRRGGLAAGRPGGSGWGRRAETAGWPGRGSTGTAGLAPDCGCATRALPDSGGVPPMRSPYPPALVTGRRHDRSPAPPHSSLEMGTTSRTCRAHWPRQLRAPCDLSREEGTTGAARRGRWTGRARPGLWMGSPSRRIAGAANGLAGCRIGRRVRPDSGLPRRACGTGCPPSDGLNMMTAATGYRRTRWPAAR